MAVPIALAPGAPVTLTGPDEALVVASGVIVTPDGQELARGTLIGPAGEEYVGAGRDGPDPGAPVQPARRERTAAAAGHAGRSAHRRGGRVAAPGRPPISGVHPPAAYPPLAVPPGPPPPERGRQGRRPVREQAALAADPGAAVRAAPHRRQRAPAADGLGRDADRPVRCRVERRHGHGRRQRGDLSPWPPATTSTCATPTRSCVDPRSRALLLYRGGAESTLCAETAVDIGPLGSVGRPVEPSANLVLRNGYMINRTGTTSPAFRDLAMSVMGERGFATNEGAAVFGVARRGVQATLGDVFLNGEPVALSRTELGCGSSGGTPVVTADADADRPTLTPTPTPTPTPTLTPTPTTTTTTRRPTTTPTRTTRPPVTTTTTRPPTTTTRPPTTTPPPPRPTVVIERVGSSFIVQRAPGGWQCETNTNGPFQVTVLATVTNSNDVKAYYLVNGVYRAHMPAPVQQGTSYTFTLTVPYVEGDIPPGAGSASLGMYMPPSYVMSQA